MQAFINVAILARLGGVQHSIEEIHNDTNNTSNFLEAEVENPTELGIDNIVDNNNNDKKQTNLPLPIQRAIDAIHTTSVDEFLEFQSQEISYNASEVESPSEKLHILESALDCYPLSIETWKSLGDYYLKNNDLDNSIVVFETGVKVTRMIHPEWGPQRTAPLEFDEHEPYLESMRGLALAHERAGNMEKCIEIAEVLCRCGNTELESELTCWYLRSNRWDDAEKFMSELKGDRDHCDIHYSNVLLQYERLRQSRDSSVSLVLDQALVVAFKKNRFVPDLLIASDAPVGPQTYFGDKEWEAVRYAAENHSLWQSIPGAVPWLTFMKVRFGSKPDEQTLVRLLRKERAKVILHAKSRLGTSIYGTQCRDRMVGNEETEFQLRSDMIAPHLDGADIYVQKHSYDTRDVNQLWQHFRYSDVIAVPFWDILLGQKEREKNDNEDHECEVKRRKTHKHECDRFCERKIWGELKVDCISVITSYLNLKEKAIVCSLNKAWLEGATSETAVTVNPDIVGPNINAVLAFVGSRFRNLKDFTLHIEDHYFYGENGKKLQLHGSSLNLFFFNISALRSVDLSFDFCTEKQVYQILKQESGLDTLNLHVSMEALDLSHVCVGDNHSVLKAIEPFTNLRMLTLSAVNKQNGRALTLSEPLKAIAKMKHLHTLSLYYEGLADTDLHSLIPIFGNLRSLTLERESGGGRQDDLNDTSLELIAKNCPQLQSLDVSYNKNFTINGIYNVLKACPLRELSAYETCVSSFHLQAIVKLSSTLRLVSFRPANHIGYNSQDHAHLRMATEASGGHIVFMAHRFYAPTFDVDLLKHHKKAREMIEKLETNASNGWNKWEEYNLKMISTNM